MMASASAKLVSISLIWPFALDMNDSLKILKRASFQMTVECQLSGSMGAQQRSRAAQGSKPTTPGGGQPACISASC